MSNAFSGVNALWQPPTRATPGTPCCMDSQRWRHTYMLSTSPPPLCCFSHPDHPASAERTNHDQIPKKKHQHPTGPFRRSSNFIWFGNFAWRIWKLHSCERVGRAAVLVKLIAIINPLQNSGIKNNQKSGNTRYSLRHRCKSYKTSLGICRLLECKLLDLRLTTFIPIIAFLFVFIVS